MLKRLITWTVSRSVLLSRMLSLRLSVMIGAYYHPYNDCSNYAFDLPPRRAGQLYPLGMVSPYVGLVEWPCCSVSNDARTYSVDFPICKYHPRHVSLQITISFVFVPDTTHPSSLNRRQSFSGVGTNADTAIEAHQLSTVKHAYSRDVINLSNEPQPTPINAYISTDVYTKRDPEDALGDEVRAHGGDPSLTSRCAYARSYYPAKQQQIA